MLGMLAVHQHLCQHLSLFLNLVFQQVPANQIVLSDGLSSKFPGTFIYQGSKEGLLADKTIYISLNHNRPLVSGEGSPAHLFQDILSQFGGTTIQRIFSFGQHQQHIRITHHYPVNAITPLVIGRQIPTQPFITHPALVPFGKIKAHRIPLKKLTRFFIVSISSISHRNIPTQIALVKRIEIVGTGIYHIGIITIAILGITIETYTDGIPHFSMLRKTKRHLKHILIVSGFQGAVIEQSPNIFITWIHLMNPRFNNFATLLIGYPIVMFTIAASFGRKSGFVSD